MLSQPGDVVPHTDSRMESKRLKTGADRSVDVQDTERVEAQDTERVEALSFSFSPSLYKYAHIRIYIKISGPHTMHALAL